MEKYNLAIKTNSASQTVPNLLILLGGSNIQSTEFNHKILEILGFFTGTGGEGKWLS